jgi:phosphatidylserine decarboxylase
VNRTPIAGTITSVRYQKGKYLNAMNTASAEQNEQNIVTVRAAEGYEVTFKQIAGLLARRIVFEPQVGQVLGRGELVGLIKFGSRVDVILPVEAELRVKKGVRVKGGASVLAAMPTSPARGARL